MTGDEKSKTIVVCVIAICVALVLMSIIYGITKASVEYYKAGYVSNNQYFTGPKQSK